MVVPLLVLFFSDDDAWTLFVCAMKRMREKLGPSGH